MLGSSSISRYFLACSIYILTFSASAFLTFSASALGSLASTSSSPISFHRKTAVESVIGCPAVLPPLNFLDFFTFFNEIPVCLIKHNSNIIGASLIICQASIGPKDPYDILVTSSSDFEEPEL